MDNRIGALEACSVGDVGLLPGTATISPDQLAGTITALVGFKDPVSIENRRGREITFNLGILAGNTYSRVSRILPERDSAVPVEFVWWS